MNPIVEKKKTMYSEVKEMCENYQNIWGNDEDFENVFNEFIHFAFIENSTEYNKADAILKYKLDKLIYNYKTISPEFFQGYFKSRIMAKLAIKQG